MTTVHWDGYEVAGLSDAASTSELKEQMVRLYPGAQNASVRVTEDEHGRHVWLEVQTGTKG